MHETLQWSIYHTSGDFHEVHSLCYNHGKKGSDAAERKINIEVAGAFIILHAELIVFNMWGQTWYMEYLMTGWLWFVFSMLWLFHLCWGPLKTPLALQKSIYWCHVCSSPLPILFFLHSLLGFSKFTQLNRFNFLDIAPSNKKNMLNDQIPLEGENAAAQQPSAPCHVWCRNMTCTTRLQGQMCHNLA